MYGEGPAEKKEDIRRAVQEFEYRPKKLRVFEKALGNFLEFIMWKKLWNLWKLLYLSHKIAR